MSELKVPVTPKVKLLVETLTTEDKIKLIEEKAKKDKKNEKKDEKEK